MQATLKGLLGPEKLHARIEDLKRTKGAPPWSEKLVVNEWWRPRTTSITYARGAPGRRSAWPSRPRANSIATIARREPARSTPPKEHR